MSGPLWVVGAGGLLGSAVVREARRRGRDVLTGAVPWSRPADASAALRAALRALPARSAGGSWELAWCAGAGVVGTAQAQLDAELATLQRFLEDLRDELGPSGAAARGALFLASSAGGVYAGVPGGHYDEWSPVAPLAPYGHAKLAAEALVGEAADGLGLPALVGRIANLYGPGQSLSKAQGVISQICRAHVSGQPSHIYVSLDTVRDYLYVDDAADVVLDALDGLGSGAGPGAGTVTKILASQQAVTLGAVLAECRHVFKRAPRVVLAASPASAFQVRSLRFTSRVWPQLDARALTPLPVGIHRTLLDLRRASAAAR